jgi:hypothetical protein
MSDATPTTPVSTTAILKALADLSRQILAVVESFQRQGPAPLATFDFEKKSLSFCVSVAASFAKACSTTSNPTTTLPARSEFATRARRIDVAIKAQT